MRRSATISREQHRRREAKAARRRARQAKGRRSPANQRAHQQRRPALSLAGRTPARVRAPRLEEKRESTIRRGLAKLNPFKGRRYGAGHRLGGGGGHRG